MTTRTRQQQARRQQATLAAALQSIWDQSSDALEQEVALPTNVRALLDSIAECAADALAEEPVCYSLTDADAA